MGRNRYHPFGLRRLIKTNLSVELYVSGVFLRFYRQLILSIWYFPCLYKAIQIYICYLPAGRFVLGKIVPEVLSTARGLRGLVEFMKIRNFEDLVLF